MFWKGELIIIREGIETPAGEAFRGSNLEPLPTGSQDHSDSPGRAVTKDGFCE